MSYHIYHIISYQIIYHERYDDDDDDERDHDGDAFVDVCK